MEDKKPTRINAELIYYQLGEIKAELAEMKSLYVTKIESHALKQEIEGLRDDLAEYKRLNTTEIKSLKNNKRFKETILWVGLVASAIINILALYNLFSGKR
jgi:regulator of replication initiation timing